MAIVHVGIDLAKNVFAVHGINEAGKPELARPSVPRARLHELIASLPPCTVAMEARSGGHHWARLFAAHGHSVRLIAPKFVAPYRMSGARGKNDAADAAAICEAVQRPEGVRPRFSLTLWTRRLVQPLPGQDSLTFPIPDMSSGRKARC
jgi:transposase